MRRFLTINALLVATLSLFDHSSAVAAIGGGGEPSRLPTASGAGPAVSCGAGCAGLFFPADDLFPPYLADPHRPGFGVQEQWYTKSAIPAASNNRLNLRVGAVFGVYRAVTPERALQAWQVGVIGAFDGMFDLGNQQDNIGWNGNYGLQWSGSLPGGVAAKIGWFHRSSHLGDEYVEKTGAKRIGYTREELGAGLGWNVFDGGRLYGETGYGYGQGNRALMEPWRLQGGAEYRSHPVFWEGRFGWYGALDVTSMEERDWRADITLQLGLLMESAGRTWRLGLEHYRGRPTVGEFFMVTEEYLSAGLWMDW